MEHLKRIFKENREFLANLYEDCKNDLTYLTESEGDVLSNIRMMKYIHNYNEMLDLLYIPENSINKSDEVYAVFLTAYFRMVIDEKDNLI